MPETDPHVGEEILSSGTRRSFLGTVLAGGTGLLLANKGLSAAPAPVKNPYQSVNWPTARQIGSATHIHCRTQEALDNLYRRGVRHLAISNYYPSTPCTADERVGQYQVEQSFVTVNGKGYSENIFHWNEILADPQTGWAKTLPSEQRDALPFEVGGPIFSSIPEDVIISPNAEQHSATDSRGHYNSLGSTFSSGTFDVKNRFQLSDHGYLRGMGLPWKDGFQRILEQLIYPDGGGITINHPVWSKQSVDDVIELLDFDPRVLGIEIWNHTCERLNGKGWALEMWDEVLATGRQCWGFSVSDHIHEANPDFLGFNIILVPAETAPQDLERACLQAYRQGRFYGVTQGTVRFQSIALHDGRLLAETSVPCRFRVISAQGTVSEQTGTRLSWSAPQDVGELRRHRYLRIEADELDGTDRLFSQPIQLT